METKFTESEVREIIKKHFINMLYSYQIEGKDITVANHNGDFTVTVVDKKPELEPF